jgi:hypothetical protein
MKATITIQLADQDPPTYYVEYKDPDKYYSGTFIETSLALNVHRLVDCLLTGKNPADFGYVPF